MYATTFLSKWWHTVDTSVNLWSRYFFIFYLFEITPYQFIKGFLIPFSKSCMAFYSMDLS